ncbi:hypothetical protein [Streptomyces sp. BE230]|uniref:hypothetical protein n=1 Tax=Streptomyces sp. BE230 TaxID=3002526 RepID=UPI002ED57979|nr:hypothetical protein [Streptomyces sp. BE230]
MAVAVIGLTAPLSNATAESSWSYGCRGYWYSTSGHGYCSSATNYPAWDYDTWYDCNNELDEWQYKVLARGYTGKFTSYECTFKINKTHVAGV